jgi:EAL domain-containing protein (putative c-di-GMP-specific phosphodiesterase class I)/CheY-like chemotaxis protein
VAGTKGKHRSSLIELAAGKYGRLGGFRDRSGAKARRERGNQPVRPIRVLVAEDNPVVQELLRTVFTEDADFEPVGIASDADEAVAMAKQSKPDVALLDVRMPGGGGPQAARGIARVCPSTRIVALSSVEDVDSVRAMMSASAVGYVTKDMPMTEILTAIRRCADGASVFTPAVTHDVVRHITNLSRRATADRVAREERSRRMAKLCRPGAISPVFQPIRSLNGGHTEMIEALSRFPGETEMSPGECFVEAASVGLGMELDLAAVEAALLELRRVGDDRATLSLNVLPQTLVSPRLASLLAGVDAERIVLELTEHAEITDYEGTRRAIAELRDRGMRLAIDDAGSGFASLRHILDLMPEMIKLDIQLVRGIGHDQPRRALASGLISFARAIDAEVVAEGIETESELQTLRDLGAGMGQGFYLARPAPLADLQLA